MGMDKQVPQCQETRLLNTRGWKRGGIRFKLVVTYVLPYW